MPACFQLFLKGSSEPCLLPTVDEAICKRFGIPCDPDKWAFRWYDTIGLCIALGKPLGSEALRKAITPGSKLQEVLTFLEENYQSDAWVEIGKR